MLLHFYLGDFAAGNAKQLEMGLEGMTSMLRKWSPLLLFVLLISLTALGFGTPTTVILGDSSPGQVLITNTGSDTVLSFTGSCGGPDCLTGLGYFGTNVGTYSMWFASGGSGNLVLESPIGDLFPLNMNGNTIDFTFGFGSSFLDGTVILNNVTDGTNAPRFIGGLFITSSNLPGFQRWHLRGFGFQHFPGNEPDNRSGFLRTISFHARPSIVWGNRALDTGTQ